jgi:integrase
MSRAKSPAQFSLVRSEVREFCKFCDDLHGPQNALSSGRFLGAIEAAHAREVRKRFSKLYHLSARGEKRPPRADGVGAYGQDPRVRPAKSFPRSLLSAFIFDGCRRERTSKDFSHPLANEFNIPLMLALVLLAGSGIRKSELFHMFADDIRAEEVRLYHPETGQYAWKGPAGGRLTGERKTFLAKVHQRRPRNRYPKGHSQFAGWKEMLLDYGSPNNYSVVQWIAPQLRELFVLLHGVYVRHVRPKGLDHPYYFVSLSQGEFGEPWTVGGFNAAFATAMRKIGEAPDSDRGRNPHGLRHLYGQTLTDLGLSPRVIQHAMHHRSILSQLAYTKPSPQRAIEALEAARRFNAPGHSVGLEPSMLQNYQWRSDPLGIFAPWNLGGR